MHTATSRRDFIKGLAGAPSAWLGTQAAFPGKQGDGYNVLFLMSDEHSPHVVACYGNEIVRTPAIDSLARQGAAFTAAYCQNPICVPSRASFATGRMPSNVGVFDNNGGLDKDVATMADVFKKAGYATGWVGKTHWGGDPRFDSPKPREASAELERRRGGRGLERARLPDDATIVDWPATAEQDTIAKEQALRFRQFGWGTGSKRWRRCENGHSQAARYLKGMYSGASADCGAWPQGAELSFCRIDSGIGQRTLPTLS